VPWHLSTVASTLLAAALLTGCTPTPSVFLHSEDSGEVVVTIGPCGTTLDVTEIIVDSFSDNRHASPRMWRSISESGEALPVRQFTLGRAPSGFTVTHDAFDRSEDFASVGITYLGPEDEGGWTFEHLPEPGQIIGPNGVLASMDDVRRFGC
jgi:hypothetical protein